jgi:RNA polymerase sigma factor (sigma-70 family)
MHSIIKQPSPLDLKELIRQCLLGKRDGQKLLFEKFVTPMARLCLRYIKDQDTAQDIMMEGFLKVFERLQNFEYRGDRSLEMWIRKIMINACLMNLRKDRTRFFMEVTEMCMDSGDTTETDMSAEDILVLINSLPEGYRIVFNLYAIDGFSHKEIAALLGISESASRSQLTHARSKLKVLLHKHGWK